MPAGTKNTPAKEESNSNGVDAKATKGKRAFLDAHVNAAITELHRKERRILLRQLEADPELLALLAQVDAEQAAAAQEQASRPLQVPAQYVALEGDALRRLLLCISKDTWSSNGGYLFRHATQFTTTAASGHAWDEEARQWLQEQGEYQKRYNKRADEHQRHCEAQARDNNIIKSARQQAASQ